MVEAFGAQARRYAARLPRELNAVVCDASDAANALAAAVERRLEGGPFYACVLLDEPRAVAARAAAATILQQLSGVDGLRSHFDALAAEQLNVNGQPIVSLQVHDPAALASLEDVILSSDALLVRSQVELLRLRKTFRGVRPWIAVAPGIVEDAPAIQTGSNGPIVVWAPQADASELGVIAYALDYFLTESVIVCKDGALPNTRARFVTPDRFSHDRVSVLIDASISDPALAIGLAKLGIPIVCASTSGAHEFVGGACTYDPWNWKSVLEAIAAARSGIRPVLISDPMPTHGLERTLKASMPEIDANGPLVSIVVPTYNRAAYLETCLARLDRQTYPNFEVVVVNDGGEPVEHVTAPYSRVRLINMEKNAGTNAASIAGMKAARGEYVAFCPDDDYFTRDGIARFVSAFQASGALVANSNGMFRFVKKGPDGVLRTVGHRWLAYMGLDRVHQMWGGAVTVATMMYHRSIFEKYGPPSAGHAGDYEYPLMISRSEDFVHVDNVTLVFNYAMDRTSAGHSVTLEHVLEEHIRIWKAYPSGGSALIENNRAATMQWFRDHHNSVYREPAQYLTEPS